MKRRRLLSLPFLSLYSAAVLAVILDACRQRWGSASWFPIAIGVAAALAIIPLRHFLVRGLSTGVNRDLYCIVAFAFGAILSLIPLPFLGRNEMLLILMSLAMSTLFGWACLGVLFQWPGFRTPRMPHECDRCGYDLTRNVSGVCPECGTPIGQDKEIPDDLDF